MAAALTATLPVPRAATADLIGLPFRRAAAVGLWLPPAGLALGLALPGVSSAARGVVVVSAVLSLLAAMLLSEAGRPGRREALAAFLLAAGNLVLTPLLCGAVARLLALPPEAAWVVLAAGAPGATTAVVVAALAGLPVRAIAVAQLGSMLAAPLVLPVMAALATSEGIPGLDPMMLIARIAPLVLLPAAAAFVLRRVAAGAVARRTVELRGVAALALAAVALAQGGVLGATVLGAPRLMAEMALLWLGAAALGALVGGTLAFTVSRRLALGGGCFGGCRNISVLWAALAGGLPVAGETALQVALAWCFVLSALVAVAGRIARRR